MGDIMNHCNFIWMILLLFPISLSIPQITTLLTVLKCLARPRFQWVFPEESNCVKYASPSKAEVIPRESLLHGRCRQEAV